MWWCWSRFGWHCWLCPAVPGATILADSMMSSLSITAIIFGCTIGGALLGMALGAKLPREHLSESTKDTVMLATGIVGTMTAVLLGLLVASAQGSFDTQRNGVAQLAASFIVLDRTLSHFGEETQPLRGLLRSSLADIIQRTWPRENGHGTTASSTEGRYESIAEKILELDPKTEAQRSLQTRALDVVQDTGQMRWLLYSQRERSIPDPLLGVMVFWLAISFASFGLFSPRNTTAVVALMICALAVSSALFLILELDRPFQGMIQISSAPLHKAMEQLGR